MKKFLDLFKIKKSKVVEELTKEFDKRLEVQKKANKKAAEDDAKERLRKKKESTWSRISTINLRSING